MISVVTLSYNCSERLMRTCQSILNQIDPPQEHIIIDNNSNDDTKEKINNIRKNYKSIGVDLIFISESDQGISDGFNKGIMQCKYEIIALLNSGDIYFKNTLQIVKNNFHSKDEILFGNLQMQGSNKVILGDVNFYKKIKSYMPRLNHPALFVKKSIYDTVGLYSLDYKIAMDYDFLLRSFMQGVVFKYVNQTFTLMEPDGISNTNKLGVYKETFNISINKFQCIVYVFYNFIISKIGHK